MQFLIAAVLLFGLIHPISKIILDTGIPLSYFCFLYILFRILFQFPIFIMAKKSDLKLKSLILPIAILGVCGACLQFFEFKGIAEGLAPGIVTLLMFSYPLWIMLGEVFTKKQQVFNKNSFKIMAGFTGVLSLTYSDFSLATSSVTLYFFPLFASIAMALWIFITSYIRKLGLSSVELSFYYDALSLLSLTVILSSDLDSDFVIFMNWLTPKQLLYMASYSLLLGLLPNLLFYRGVLQTSPIRISLIMASEPLLSNFYSSLLWNYYLGSGFFIGVMLILYANGPDLTCIKIFNSHINSINFINLKNYGIFSHNKKE